MELTDTFTVSSPIERTWPILCDIERIAPCMPGARLTEVDGDEYRGEVKLKVGPISTRFKGTATLVERDDDAHRAVLRASGKDTGGKGNAHATITATAEPAADGGTTVTIATDLSITGKVAQFGRSAMSDISTKLLGQFVACLESDVLAGRGAPSADAAGASADAPGDEPTPDDDGPAGPVVDVTDATAAAAGPGSPVETAPAPPIGGMPEGAAATGGGAGAGAATSASGARRIDAPEAEPIDLLDAAGAPVAKKVAAPLAALMALFFVLQWRRRRRRRAS